MRYHISRTAHQLAASKQQTFKLLMLNFSAYKAANLDLLKLGVCLVCTIHTHHSRGEASTHITSPDSPAQNPKKSRRIM